MRDSLQSYLSGQRIRFDASDSDIGVLAALQRGLHPEKYQPHRKGRPSWTPIEQAFDTFRTQQAMEAEYLASQTTGRPEAFQGLFVAIHEGMQISDAKVAIDAVERDVKNWSQLTQNGRRSLRNTIAAIRATKYPDRKQRIRLDFYDAVASGYAAVDALEALLVLREQRRDLDQQPLLVRRQFLKRAKTMKGLVANLLGDEEKRELATTISAARTLVNKRWWEFWL